MLNYVISREMVHIDTEVKLDYKDVLIRPKRSTLSSRSQVTLERTYKFKHSPKRSFGGVTEGIVPIVVANMDTTGTFEMAKALHKHNMMVALHKHYEAKDIIDFFNENQELITGISAGTSSDDFKKICDIIHVVGIEAIGFICLDVANGYSEHFVECVSKYRREFPEAVIMAGNVVTSEMTEQLILAGADIVKVGIGPGSVCTTRKQTGVGYPQLSAIMECADAAHGLGGLIVGDGGIKCTGDFCKGFGAGADFLMAGGMFAGYDESGGELIEKEFTHVTNSNCSGNDVTNPHLKTIKKYKQFYGMSSSVAMEKHSDGVANYRASEGKVVEIPYRGPVDNLALDILGGLRSMCTYIGASSLKEVSKRCTFVRVSQQLNEVFGSSLTDMRN